MASDMEVVELSACLVPLVPLRVFAKRGVLRLHGGRLTFVRYGVMDPVVFDAPVREIQAVASKSHRRLRVRHGRHHYRLVLNRRDHDAGIDQHHRVRACIELLRHAVHGDTSGALSAA